MLDCLLASACETSIADIVFILDSSGSIRDANPSDGSYDNWDLALTFISNFVNEFTLGTSATQVLISKRNFTDRLVSKHMEIIIRIMNEYP